MFWLVFVAPAFPILLTHPFRGTRQFPTGALTPNLKGKIPLHYAAREGRTAVVHFFLQVAPTTAAMASVKDKLALHFAAGEGHLDVVRALLSVYPQGASLPSAKGKLPLHFCARWGYQEVATELLRHYPDAIRALDWEGSLPLHEACREGQGQMARFLVDRFPEALATVNIRNELPLVRAVHANSLELVLFLLQAWPEGARHVLQHVTVDDRIASWSPGIVEALLRATVDCWDGFAPWQALPPAVWRLHAQPNHVLPVDDDEDKKAAKAAKKDKSEKPQKEKKDKSEKKEKKDKAKKKEAEAEVGTIEDRQARLWTAGPFTSIQVERLDPTASSHGLARSARSKSPMLDDNRDEITVRPRKRARGAVRRLDEEMGHVFHPLQAALVAHGSLTVLKHVHQLFPPAPLDVLDDQNRSLFHLALENAGVAGDEEGAAWVLQHLYEPRWATLRATPWQALPLHTALRTRASSRLVSALLQAHPSSAVEACGTRDEWETVKPLLMACQGNCDYSTVYLLLRADPSVIHKKADCKIGPAKTA